MHPQFSPQPVGPQQGMTPAQMLMQRWAAQQHQQQAGLQVNPQHFAAVQQFTQPRQDPAMNGHMSNGRVPNGHTAASFPSMADLAKNTEAGGTSSTVQDQDVKVMDPRGGLVSNFSRFSTFDETPFPLSIKADLKGAGFPAPSQIQQYTWPLATQGRDVIGVAATGSGKTLAFLLPAFQYILERNISARDPVLLVLAPTRELACQIEDEAKKFGKGS